MELLNYWKEILITLLGILTVLSTISEKFRETILFWRNSKNEAKKTDLEVIKEYQAYYRDELLIMKQELENEKQAFRKELEDANKLTEKAHENNVKLKGIVSKLTSHIRYLEKKLTDNKIPFEKLKDSGTN